MSHDIRVHTYLAAGNAHVLQAQWKGAIFEVEFMPTPAGGPEAMWFCLRVEAGESVPPDTVVRCLLHLPDTLLGGGGDAESGFRPVYRTEQTDWTRVDAVEPTNRADGRPVIGWDMPGGEGAIDVALCYPYGEAELTALLTDTALRPDVIGVSERGRPLVRVSNSYGDREASRPGVYCVARQHAGETPGSWVLDGFLREIAAAGEGAPLVWAVPIVDPDGAAAGCYGKDRFPYDYNRAWGAPGYPEAKHPERGTHPMRYEVNCIQHDMRQWQTRCRPLLVVDFHAPAMFEADGLYCYLRNVDDDGRGDAIHRRWTDAVERALGPSLASERFVRTGSYASRWNTARVGDFVNETLGLPSLSFETPYACAGETILTRECYGQAGQRIAQAVIKESEARTVS